MNENTRIYSFIFIFLWLPACDLSVIKDFVHGLMKMTFLLEPAVCQCQSCLRWHKHGYLVLPLLSHSGSSFLQPCPPPTSHNCQNAHIHHLEVYKDDCMQFCNFPCGETRPLSSSFISRLHLVYASGFLKIGL